MSLIYGVITGLICPLIGFFGSWIFTQDAQVAFLFTIATVIIALGQPIAAYVRPGRHPRWRAGREIPGNRLLHHAGYVRTGHARPALGGRRGAMDAPAGYCGFVGRVYSVLPGNPRGHFRSPRPLGCVDESRCLNPLEPDCFEHTCFGA